MRRALHRTLRRGSSPQNSVFACLPLRIVESSRSGDDEKFLFALANGANGTSTPPPVAGTLVYLPGVS